MADEKAKELIRKLAIKNAMDYGKAQEGNVIGNVISKAPELKKEMKSLAKSVAETVAEVNRMQRGDLERAYSEYAEEFSIAERERAERTAKHNYLIEGAEKGKLVTRFPPEPGGYMHIGHAKPAFIEDEIRSLYSGKLMLYFDDTNPEKEKQEYVDAFKSDLEWLGIRFDGDYYGSDSIPMLYEKAAEMIQKGKAYACTCDAEKIKADRAEGRPCIHKKQGHEKNSELWQKMLSKGFRENEAVLRFNGEMDAQNTTMRDPTLFRIKEARHYRQGERYSVWPTYDFSTPIVDSTKGITDVVRSKEYELRDALYFAVLDSLKLRKPRIHSISRLEIQNNITSKRKLNAMLQEKQIKGFDDPLLVTIRALRRRGIRPEAIKEFALSFGMGKQESAVELERLLAYNRKIIDNNAKRLFFIEDPIGLKIEGMEKPEIRVRLHPSAELGFREYTLDDGIYISASDAKQLKPGQLVRLKDAFSIRIKKAEGHSISATYASEDAEAQRVQWISDKTECVLWQIGDLLEGERFNENGIARKHGYAEGYAKKLNEGEIVQFERLGYFKLDNRKEMRFLSL